MSTAQEGKFIERIIEGPAGKAAEWAASAHVAPGPLQKLEQGTRKTLEWAVGVNTVHPSMHRLKNALGLTIGMLVGRQTMNLLTGETYRGDKIDKEDVPAPLRPLHGIMAYNHYSDDPNDRWMRVVDSWVPGLLGAAGAVMGAHDFGMKQQLVQDATKLLKEVDAHAVAAAGKEMTAELAKKVPHITLEEAEKAAIVAQAWPWRVLSGVTAIFGSASSFQLMTGPTNFGSTLGASFLGTVERNKLHTPYLPWLQEFVSANKHGYAYGPASMVNKLHEYMVQNVERNPEQQRKMAYAIMEPWFGRRVNQEHITKFLEEVHATRDKFFREGGIPEELQAKARDELGKVMKGVGLENTFNKIGLDPETAMIGRNGFMEYLSKMLGADSRLTNLENEYRQSYRLRNGVAMPADLSVNDLTRHSDGKTLLTGGLIAGGIATGVASTALRASDWHEENNDRLFGRQGQVRPSSGIDLSLGTDKLSGPNSVAGTAAAAAPGAATPATGDTPKSMVDEILDSKPLRFSRLPGSERPSLKEKKKHFGFLNGSVLPALEWGADAMNSPDTLGSHRVTVALGLTAGGYAGMEFANILFGRNLAGKKIAIESVPEFLHGIYNKFPYNPMSDHPKDRWGYVMHFLIPAITGTAGVVTASSMFFRSRVKKAEKADFIDDYEDKVTMEEAKPWTGLTAATSLFATPAGFNYLPIPFVNYGASLGTRFTLSAGRKMIFPGIGEMWTGNASRYPLGPTRIRDLMVKYAVNNPSDDPVQLEEMTLGILKPWFDNVTPEQVDAFVHKIEEDRDKFLQKGGIPEEFKDAAEKELLKHFKGAGLEKTLREIGLDPTKATLGSNGLSGEIAKYLGAGKHIDEIHKDYTHKYTERLKAEQQASQEPPQIAT